MSTKDNKNYFRDFLRKNGYKATPPRLEVLSILKNAKRPLSPHAIIEGADTKIDQATIYRILKVLKKTGMIRQVDFRHNHPHYELSDIRDHHHLICIQCGISEEILGCEVDSMRQSVLRQAKQFREIREHSLEFYGFCAVCMRKRARTAIND